MSLEDANLLKKIINVLKLKHGKYSELYNLEIEGKKEDLEYKKTIAQIIEIKSYEQALYNQLNFNNSQEMLQLISEKVLPKTFPSNMDDFILYSINDDRIMQKVICVLSQKIFEDPSVLRSEYFGPIFKNIRKEITAQEYQHDAFVSAKLKEFLEYDKYNSMLSFVERAKKDLRYNIYTDAITKLKYDLAFVNEKIESLMIDNSFNVQNDICLSYKLTSGIKCF